MAGRKLIGVLLTNPEAAYQQRILDGLFKQCDIYDYDLAVFAPLVQSSHDQKDYLHGEANIFELVNFELLDGLVVVPLTLSENGSTFILENIQNKIRNRCTIPVISLDIPMDCAKLVCTDDRTAFHEITSHIIKEHNCTFVYFLGGPEDSPVTSYRLSGFRDAFEEHGLAFGNDLTFFGEFWYPNGEHLADRIASGDIKMPEAVVCASDHIAIGLANRLLKHGIKVPEQVIVTGYDATQEAVLNQITITSYIPMISKMAADAIDRIRKEIEPDKARKPADLNCSRHLCIGSSCGCREDMDYIKNGLGNSTFHANHNYGDENVKDNLDIGMLLDSYMYEQLTSSASPEQCLKHIHNFNFLIRPYSDFYLCLDDNWLDTESKNISGYPEQMRTVIHCVPEEFRKQKNESFADLRSDKVFDTKTMLPELFTEHDKASVFYFSPVHFNDETFGYAVMRCELRQQHKINCVYRNFIRNVNNALQMVRVQQSLLRFSVRDLMTGLFNRRGMDIELKRMLSNASPTDKYLVFVIDMDRLKYINDTFGHAEGDYGINTVANAAHSITRNSEICVRAGGDEFYIIGIGDYSIADQQIRLQRFQAALDEENRTSGKPYTITASIGCCRESIMSGFTFDDIIQLADQRMYEYKVEHKRSRD